MSLTEEKRLKRSLLGSCMLGVATSREQLVLAPAKLNLRLKLLGRRHDGYHLLSMLNVSTSLSDELRITLGDTPGVVVSVQPPESIPGPHSDNLVVRAWDEFWREFSSDGPPCGALVVISKKIPIGGGLGGGSSDAAAMLRFLVANFGGSLGSLLGLSKTEVDSRVLRVALRLGADVPYAYHGGICWVTGIGGDVLPLGSLTPCPEEVLITMPPVSVPTVDFYRFLRERLPEIVETRDVLMERLVGGQTGSGVSQLIENDFEEHVVAFRPEVGEVLRLARQYYPETTALTGSGAAIFSLVPSHEAASIRGVERSMEEAGAIVYRARVLKSF